MCTGCGLCEEICPKVFLQDNHIAHVIVEEIPPDLLGVVREAKERCPVEAISLEEEEGLST